ncbi:MAG: c-type cytochrome biogenesis protein CcmI [Candidatus Accumulibacter sp.]|jgi:cytochrome c-type biogenesis protein CcmH|nr:c-type cytochrome biogenesis protein CcmI [Accumulibacter sp.]
MSETIAFLLAAGVLLLAALAILLRPLLRGNAAMTPAVDRREANLAILRDELRELERGRDAGLLDESDFAQAKSELQRRLLEEIEPETPASPADPATGKRTAIALLVALPLAAAGGYALLGNPLALDPARTRAHAQTQDMDIALQGLAARLAANPDDPRGWILLARSYKARGRFAESAEAFGHAEAWLDRDPALLADYAESLALAGGGFAGQPDELIARALEKAPGDPQVLFVAGASANARHDFAAVADYWGRLLPMLDPDSDDARTLGAIVEQAKRALEDAETVPGGAPSPERQPAKN